jgi:hypothetical protein
MNGAFCVYACKAMNWAVPGYEIFAVRGFPKGVFRPGEIFG